MNKFLQILYKYPWLIGAALVFIAIMAHLVENSFEPQSRDRFIANCTNSTTTLNDCASAWAKLQQEIKEESARTNPGGVPGDEQRAEMPRGIEEDFQDLLFAAFPIIMGLFTGMIVFRLVKKL